MWTRKISTLAERRRFKETLLESTCSGFPQQSILSPALFYISVVAIFTTTKRWLVKFLGVVTLVHC